MVKKPYVILGIRNSPLLMQYGTLDSFRQKIRGTKWHIPTTFISSQNLAGAHCYHVRVWKNMRRLMAQELRAGKYTKQFFAKIHRSFKRVLKNIAKFANKDFSQESSEKLIEYFDTFYEIYLVTLFPMIVAIYSSDLQDLLKQELSKVLKKEEKDHQTITTLIAMLLTPLTLTFIQQEEQLLFTIQKRFERKYQDKSTSKKIFVSFCQQPAIRKILGGLVRKYGWFHMEYMRESWQERKYLRHIWQRIRDAQRDPQAWKNQTSSKQRLKIIRKQQEVFFKNHPNSQFLKKLIFVLQELSIIVDYSKADLIYGIYLARPLIEEIARRLSVNSWVLVRNLTPQELHQALKRGKLTARQRKDVQERAKGYALLLKNGKITLFQGIKARHMRKQLMEEKPTKGIRELEGLIAMTGKVRGVVKKVTSVKDLAKFKEGDIMVTHDTSTELTSVMKKASAIVADLGGLVSHTAIVAREFKTPCLVSTKIATKVFKDGDKVEVDAERGLIKKLN